MLQSKFKFSNDEMKALLHMTNEEFLTGSDEASSDMSSEQLTRVSLLLGIEKALLLLFSGNKDRAFSWIDRKNTLPPFEGQTPRKFLGLW